MVPRMQKFGSSLLTRCSIGGVHLNGLRDALRSCHARRAALQLIDPKCGHMRMTCQNDWTPE
eukprot:3896418-Prorocentrum_lima.AAC.1